MFKPKSIAAAVWAIQLYACGIAWSQSQSAPPPADVMAAASELVVVTRAADQFKSVLPVIFQTLRPAITQGRPQVDRDYDELIPPILNHTYNRMAELTRSLASIYARNFSLDELKELITFYRSPIGQKLLDRQPRIMAQSMTAGQDFGRTIMNEVRPRLIEELRKRGHNI